MSDTEGEDTTMVDAGDVDDEANREDGMMYGHGAMTEQELNDKYPNRPKNRHKTLPFSDLYLTLFNPLQQNLKKPAGAGVNRRKQGPHGPMAGKSPNEVRRTIIEKFITRWRKEVGDDIFPAFRLIVPEKDRDRGMYGLKELTIGKLLVKVMKIDKNSEDGYNLLHWKLPGVKSASAMAGDFAGRCFEVISKRPMRTTPGSMTIAEANELLDRLSVAQKEENQQPIMEEFYNRMNAEELMWLIRMILRQMKVGATEKTILHLWHPDAENLFNISSSLRRVCWELYDQDVRLEGEQRGIHLMECFQPQLAAFQMRSMEQMVARMKPTEEDPVFWIEEKLDGERMQLHMIEDDAIPGGKRFMFWSRKAKDYTYLYGKHLEDSTGALTKHIRDAFGDTVRNIILDGEMITWDMETDRIYPFGHLKTAAISEQQTQTAVQGGNRPLYRVFDCLYLNDRDLTRAPLRKRREALDKAITDVPRRLEVHKYQEARDASEIEPKLREVVADRSEGLVLKNPRSVYRLNERNDDWMKVKPEYMTEFGEALDCVVIGGYYGSGKRGGGLSSFLCGLRVPEDAAKRGGINPQLCYSFFKVGGGFSAADYAEIRHKTEGKWMDYDADKPPRDWFMLGGDNKQAEKPDVWIKPEDSVVFEVKAASVTETSQFACKVTLRFPRFKKLRSDKTWQQALTTLDFDALRESATKEQQDKKFKVDDARRKRSTRKRKRELQIQGQDEQTTTPYAGPATKVFEAQSFFIMSEATKPLKKTKAEIEAFVKANGGNIVASEALPETVCIADRNLVKVASVQKRGERTMLRPQYLYDCVAQSEKDGPREGVYMLPVETGRHVYFVPDPDERALYESNVDEFGDSFARDVSNEELQGLLKKLTNVVEEPAEALTALREDGALEEMPGFMFSGSTAYFGEQTPEARRLWQFGGGEVAISVDEKALTHVIAGKDGAQADELRKQISGRKRLPRMVSLDWIMDSWEEKTRLDEERYAA